MKWRTPVKLKTYDLHTHILPGLDDGSPDSEVSWAMLRMATEAVQMHGGYGYCRDFRVERLMPFLRALERDPDSRLLLEQLRRTYSKRLALGQRTTGLS